MKPGERGQWVSRRLKAVRFAADRSAMMMQHASTLIIRPCRWSIPRLAVLARACCLKATQISEADWGRCAADHCPTEHRRSCETLRDECARRNSSA